MVLKDPTGIEGSSFSGWTVGTQYVDSVRWRGLWERVALSCANCPACLVQSLLEGKERAPARRACQALRNGSEPVARRTGMAIASRSRKEALSRSQPQAERHSREKYR